MSPSLHNADRMTTNNSILNSCKDKDGGTMNFDDHINQQRDAYIFEKMEQQQKVALHRKNSENRQSIES